MRRLLFPFVALVGAFLGGACGARTDLGATGEATGGEGGGASSPRCGDGVVQGREACDDGNTIDTDACRNTCIEARCGDGVKSQFEGCDDGNVADGDGCASDCALTSCGNGRVDPGEQCDSVDPSVCTPLCLSPACGDGFLDPVRETCDAGAANEDRPAIELVQGTFHKRVNPTFRVQEATDFYDHFSASAHTGFEQAQASFLFLHLQTGADLLSLFSIHGIDRDTSGISQGDGAVSQLFAGLPPGASVLLADDNMGELFDAGALVVRGDWRYQDNTDGGIIGTLTYPGDWIISVDSDFIQGVSKFGFIDGGANILPLDMSETVFLVAKSTPSTCRLDCTIPRCGDLVIDAGEVCDDGNQASGDGCTADCSATE
jgi:cysteine-rich repeat protein